MGDALKVKLTCEEGDLLFRISAGFGLPEKLGKHTLGVGDRAVAADDVRALFRLLRTYSPMAQTSKRLILFGPADNREKKTESAIRCDGCGREVRVESVTYPLINPDLEVEVKLDDEALSGAVWCILGVVFPGEGEKVALAVQVQNDIIWPIAAKLGRTKAIREFVGYSEGTPRRWKTDEDYSKEKKAEEKPEEKK